MKKLVLLMCIMFGVAVTLSAQQKVTVSKVSQHTKKGSNGASIQFDTLQHDFKTVKEGVKATHVFVFENTGTTPITLTMVKPSCGCTTPVWPKAPIMPGEKAEIKAIFDTKGRPGPFYKTITVTSNAPTVELVIKGVVERTASDELKGNQIKLGN